MKKLIIFSILILVIGYLYRKETIYINIYSSYYVTTYFGISILIITIIVLCYLLKLGVKKITNKRLQSK